MSYNVCNADSIKRNAVISDSIREGHVVTTAMDCVTISEDAFLYDIIVMIFNSQFNHSIAS